MVTITIGSILPIFDWRWFVPSSFWLSTCIVWGISGIHMWRRRLSSTSISLRWCSYFLPWTSWQLYRLYTVDTAVLQGVYTGGILHYDTLNNVSLNFPSLLGVGLGALASWLVLARLRTGYKMASFIGFVLVVSYLIIMYFLISPDTNIEKLYLPVVLRNMGNTMIYIVLTTYLR